MMREFLVFSIVALIFGACSCSFILGQELANGCDLDKITVYEERDCPDCICNQTALEHRALAVQDVPKEVFEDRDKPCVYHGIVVTCDPFNDYDCVVGLNGKRKFVDYDCEDGSTWRYECP